MSRKPVLFQWSLFDNSLTLLDGTVLRRCEVPEPIYASEQCRIFSLATGKLCPMKLFKKSTKSRGNYGRKQPYLYVSTCWKGKQKKYYAHRLMSVWLDPPKSPEEKFIDHLNGILADNRAENLQYVTKKENDKRAGILRILRSIGRDPTTMSRAELLSIFSHYRFEDPSKRMEYELTHHMEI